MCSKVDLVYSFSSQSPVRTECRLTARLVAAAFAAIYGGEWRVEMTVRADVGVVFGTLRTES